MSERMTLLRRHYDGTERGEIGIPEEFWTEDFVWDVLRPQTIPGGGLFEGKEKAIAALRAATEGWDYLAIIPEEIFEEEERIIVMGHIDVKQDGKSATTPVVHIWHFRGKEKQTHRGNSACFYHNLKGLRIPSAAMTRA